MSKAEEYLKRATYIKTQIKTKEEPILAGNNDAKGTSKGKE